MSDAREKIIDMLELMLSDWQDNTDYARRCAERVLDATLRHERLPDVLREVAATKRD